MTYLGHNDSWGIWRETATGVRIRNWGDERGGGRRIWG